MLRELYSSHEEFSNSKESYIFHGQNLRVKKFIKSSKEKNYANSKSTY
jgi:hypothetical protein